MTETKPITFSRSRFLLRTPEAIADEIADLSRWPAFAGYGPLPGIATAAYEERTDGMVGTRIRVENTDGSTHLETVEVWQPPERVVLRLHDFTSPVRRLASHFEEAWHFERETAGTLVTREVAMYPRSALTRPLLWLISFLMRRAIGRHLEQIANEPGKQTK